jgi:hypothetical protein
LIMWSIAMKSKCISIHPISRACCFAFLGLFAATATTAQWVAVGRKVVGRITSAVQPRDAKNPGYGAATVILDADAGKVFETAVSLLQKNATIVITKKDDTRRSISFKQGDWTADVKVSEVGDHVSQLLIVSGAGPGDASGTPVVLDAVKRICDQLGVKYSLESP